MIRRLHRRKDPAVDKDRVGWADFGEHCAHHNSKQVQERIARDELAITMFDEGKSREEIGAAIGSSPVQVKKRLSRLKRYFPDDKPTKGPRAVPEVIVVDNTPPIYADSPGAGWHS